MKIAAALCLIFLVLSGCPMNEDDLYIIIPPDEPQAMLDSHTGVTRGTGMGEQGTITVILTVIDGWIMELSIDGPAENHDLFQFVHDEYILLVYTTNLVDVVPDCCSNLNSTDITRVILAGMVQAAEHALAKNKAGNDWYVIPIYQEDGTTLIAGTAMGSAQLGLETITIELKADAGYITQLSLSGILEYPSGMEAHFKRMIAQNSVIVNNISGAQELSLAVREAAHSALQKLVTP